jgi:DNA recombination protein RmuC
MVIVTLVLGLFLGLALGAVVGVLWARSRRDDGLVDQAELLQGLDRLSDQVLHLDRERVAWQREFRVHVDQLRRETAGLSTALRKPQVRGRWGELHLRRAVELAGLVDRCDFTEQVRLDDGRLRPDLVVNLAGGKRIVVDAKVPLDAFLDAAGADSAERDQHLARHARQLRTHVDQLGAKAYWRELAESPEFVVMFVPAESFFAAAAEADAGLLEYAAERRVVIATPSTLIALLRTVAHGWTHEALADQAREIQRLGRDLHQRLATFSGHLDGVGRSLNAAVSHYNRTAASLDARVLVAARRFNDLSVTDDELPAPRLVELQAVRRAAEAPEADGPTVISRGMTLP